MTKSNNDDHRKWLMQRIQEAHTVKVGMSRIALLKVFEVEGGLQPMLPNRYILRSCPEIHVDVTFDTAGKTIPIKAPVTSDEKLAITSMSRFYVDYVVCD